MIWSCNRTLAVLLSIFLYLAFNATITPWALAQEKQSDPVPTESGTSSDDNREKPGKGKPEEDAQEKQKESEHPDSSHEEEKRRPSPPKPAPLDGVNYIFDSQIMLYAESQMNKMIKAKQALTCTELENQADDRKCIVNLVQPRTEQRPQATQYRELSKSVVAILISRKHLDHWHVVPAATGFFISDEGVIATNRHVFNPSDEYMFAMTSDYALHPIQEVLGANRANDLAYCRIDSSDYKGLALSRNTPVGSDISVISHPSGRFYTYSQGVITRRYIRPPQRASTKENQTEKGQSPPVRVPTRWITISAEFGKGSSGGPVIDRRGNVVGMATSTSSLRVGKKTDTVSQMVFRDCVPAGVLLDWINQEQ